MDKLTEFQAQTDIWLTLLGQISSDKAMRRFSELGLAARELVKSTSVAEGIASILPAYSKTRAYIDNYFATNGSKFKSITDTKHELSNLIQEASGKSVSVKTAERAMRRLANVSTSYHQACHELNLISRDLKHSQALHRERAYHGVILRKQKKLISEYGQITTAMKVICSQLKAEMPEDPRYVAMKSLLKERTGRASASRTQRILTCGKFFEIYTAITAEKKDSVKKKETDEFQALIYERRSTLISMFEKRDSLLREYPNQQHGRFIDLNRSLSNMQECIGQCTVELWETKVAEIQSLIDIIETDEKEIEMNDIQKEIIKSLQQGIRKLSPTIDEAQVSEIMKSIWDEFAKVVDKDKPAEHGSNTELMREALRENRKQEEWKTVLDTGFSVTQETIDRLNRWVMFSGTMNPAYVDQIRNSTDWIDYHRSLVKSSKHIPSDVCLMIFSENRRIREAIQQSIRDIKGVTYNRRFMDQSFSVEELNSLVAALSSSIPPSVVASVGEPPVPLSEAILHKTGELLGRKVPYLQIKNELLECLDSIVSKGEFISFDDVYFLASVNNLLAILHEFQSILIKAMRVANNVDEPSRLFALYRKVNNYVNHLHSSSFETHLYQFKGIVQELRTLGLEEQVKLPLDAMYR